MKTIRRCVIGLGVVVALAATAGSASAWPHGGPFATKHPYPHNYTLGNALFGSHQQLPTYQAAPWYLYWPYDGHFMTPAPIGGAFYGAPNAGGGPANPYFPGAGYGGYGGLPGGPIPVPVAPVPVPGR